MSEGYNSSYTGQQVDAAVESSTEFVTFSELQSRAASVSANKLFFVTDRGMFARVQNSSIQFLGASADGTTVTTISTTEADPVYESDIKGLRFMDGSNTFNYNIKPTGLYSGTQANGYLLSSDGNGGTSWIAPSSLGGVTSLLNQEGDIISDGTIGMVNTNKLSVQGINVVTTAPTSDNSSGTKIAVLSSEPSQYRRGWLYFIAS